MTDTTPTLRPDEPGYLLIIGPEAPVGGCMLSPVYVGWCAGSPITTADSIATVSGVAVALLVVAAATREEVARMRLSIHEHARGHGWYAPNSIVDHLLASALCVGDDGGGSDWDQPEEAPIFGGSQREGGALALVSSR